MLAKIIYSAFFLYKAIIENYNLNNRKKFNKVNIDILKKKKKSDTLVILGSGSSINQITNDDWLKFKDYDTFGFNFWPLHNFVPNYYLFETPRDYERRKTFVDLLKFTLDSYSHSIILYKDQKLSGKENKDVTDKFLNNGYFIKQASIPGSSINLISLGLNYINLFDRFNVFQNLHFYKRASVVYLILLGLRLKYKKIILCGIDLSNSKYFYEENLRKNPNVPNYIIKDLNAMNRDYFRTLEIGVHKTNDKKFGDITVFEIIDLISKHKISRNCTLYTYNKSSLLSDILPVYNI